MNIFFDNLDNIIGLFFYAFIRIGAALMVAPVLGTRLIPTRIRLIVTVCFSMLVVPLLNQTIEHDILSLNSILIIINQFIIGVSMGLVLQIVFQIFVIMGEMVAMQSGLGMAVMNDPSTQASVPMVGQFFLMLISYLFFLLNGHLILFEVIVESFHHLPINSYNIAAIDFKQIAVLGSWMFLSALKIAIPMMIALLMVQVALGVMTRAAPQLNIFTIGFPLTMILGLIIIWLKSPAIFKHFSIIYEHGIEFIRSNIIGI